VVTDGCRYLPIAAVWSQLPAGNDSLLPRRRPIVDPQVWFDVVRVDQLLKALTWFVTSDDSGKRHASTEPGRDHCNSRCASEPVFLFVHANHDAWLLRIQLRRIADQVSIEDQVADDRNVRTLAVLKHGK
jgi:hypothetical protein